MLLTIQHNIALINDNGATGLRTIGRAMQASRRTMGALPLKSDDGISVVPVVLEHAEALVLLVQQNAEHLFQYLPALSGCHGTSVFQ